MAREGEKEMPGRGGGCLLYTPRLTGDGTRGWNSQSRCVP